MLRNLMTAWSIPEVRARLLYVVGMIMVFVVGLHIPVPGVNLRALEELIRQLPILTLFDTFSGSAFRRFTIFALGITPYINASIIMQLLTVAVPQLEAMSKEGESGRKQIAKITRYLTVGLALFQAIGLVTMLSNQSGQTGAPIFSGGWLTIVQVVISLTAGTTFLMWLGESITEKGIGQGVSLMIFMGIMARLPYDVKLTATALQGAQPGVAIFQLLMLLVLFLATVVGIIYVTGGTRRIPIQHAKRQMGTRMVQPQSSFLPFKVNTAGVMPIIFAISLLMFPATIASYFNNPSKPGPLTSFARFVIEWTTPGQNLFASLFYAVLIVLFTYFYAAIAVNIPELTDNLKKYGSFIPGIRPGRPTQEYLDRVLTRITFAGALFLAAIGLVQYWIPMVTGIATFTLVGGTSLLIVVGVALDTMQNLESHLVMRNYEGFIRQSSRRRGGATGLGGVSLR